jgi:hypothetical protein
MQDYAKIVDVNTKVGVTRMNRWLIFSPVKNSLAEARKLSRKNLPVECAGSGEMDVYRATAELLRVFPENNIAAEQQKRLGGIRLSVGPRIVCSPSFAVTADELWTKIRGLKITRDSTLCIEGEGVQIEGLDLDGTLLVNTAPDPVLRLKNLRISNPGWPIRTLADGGRYEEVDAMRGYLIHQEEPGTARLDFA